MEAPAATADGAEGKPAHGSQCSENVHCCYCGIRRDPSSVGHRGQPSLQQEDAAHAHTSASRASVWLKPLLCQLKPRTHLEVYVPSIYYTVPTDIRREKSYQQNTLAFTNSILNVEAPTEGKISGSLKDESKNRAFLLLPIFKLVWTDVPWNLQTAQLCAQEDVAFLRQESEIFYHPNFNQQGIFHFPLKGFSVCCSVSVLNSSASRGKAVFTLLESSLPNYSVVNGMLNLSSGKIALTSWD